MGKNPLVPQKNLSKVKAVDLPHSAGILDDYAVRKSVHTKELYVGYHEYVKAGLIINSTGHVGINLPTTSTYVLRAEGRVYFLEESGTDEVQTGQTGAYGGSGYGLIVDDGITEYTVISPTAAVFAGDVGITRASRIRATRQAAQSIPNATETVILWDTETFDTRGEYDTATGKFTAEKAGYYQVNAALVSASTAWAAAEYWYIGIFKNNVAYAWGVCNYHDAAITLSATSVVSDIVYLAEGGYITIKCLHNQGGAVNTFAVTPNPSCYFSVHRLS